MPTETIECPSGLTLSVRNMKAKEMALLADDGSDADEGAHSKKKKKAVKRKNPITAILGGCVLEVVDPGPYTPDIAVAGALIDPKGVGSLGKLNLPELLLCDRFFSLVRVRATTWGDDYEFRVRCRDKACDRYAKPFLWSIPLSELEMKKLPEASRKRVREKQLTFELTLGGKTAKFKLQQGHEEMNQPDLSAIPKGEIFLAQCASRLIYVEGVDVTNFDSLMAWVGELDMQEVADATATYDEVDGGIETNTMAECPKCGMEFDVAVPFDGPSFLLPDKKTRGGKPVADSMP